jgi:hypothetical protein
MSGLLFLAAFFLACSGSGLIGFALSGVKRARIRGLWGGSAAVASFEALEEGMFARISGVAVGPTGSAKAATFTSEIVVYEKLIFEQWTRDWALVDSEVHGPHVMLSDPSGARVAVELEGATFALCARATSAATQMFDEEDAAEYTEMLPNRFRAQMMKHLAAHPGTYRVRAERIALGTSLIIVGRVRSAAAEKELATGARYVISAQPAQPLLVSDLGARELLFQPPRALLVASAIVGLAALAAGVVLLIRVS